MAEDVVAPDETVYRCVKNGYYKVVDDQPRCVEHTFAIDIQPDPIKGDPELPDNPAHARICGDRDFASSSFARLKEELAELALIVLDPK